jgi:hypothetical protein
MDRVIELHKRTIFADAVPTTLEDMKARMKYRLGEGKDRRCARRSQGCERDGLICTIHGVGASYVPRGSEMAPPLLDKHLPHTMTLVAVTLPDTCEQKCKRPQHTTYSF